MRLSERKLAILKALNEGGEDFGYFSFKGIAGRSGVPLTHIRRHVRALARAGLAEYGRGLWSDDGMPAGSGYAITKAGRAALNSGASDV